MFPRLDSASAATGIPPFRFPTLHANDRAFDAPCRRFADFRFSFEGAYQEREILSLAQQSAYGLRARIDIVAPSRAAVAFPNPLTPRARIVPGDGPSKADRSEPKKPNVETFDRPRARIGATSLGIAGRARPTQSLKRPLPYLANRPASRRRYICVVVRSGSEMLRCAVIDGRAFVNTIAWTR